MEYWEDGGWYVGRLKEVPGVFSQGATIQELEENIRDAYQLVISDNEDVHSRAAKRRDITVEVCNGVNWYGN